MIKIKIKKWCNFIKYVIFLIFIILFISRLFNRLGVVDEERMLDMNRICENYFNLYVFFLIWKMEIYFKSFV